MTVAPRSAQASTQHLSRAGFRAASGVLLVLRDTPAPLPPVPGQPAAVPGNPLEGAEVLLAVWDDGSATGLHGHVDLGTGLRTALSQIVAEELNIEVDKVGVVMGSTTAAPNQGATIASASLQIHAEPLRRAAAQAGAWLRANGPLRAEQHVELMLDLQTSVKPPEEYRVVGQSVPRVDLHAKLTGQTIFVHDMRVPGMLHGRVIRPPYAGADHGDFIGNTLASVDEASIAHIPGMRAVVVIRDFVGVIAEREEHAEQAMRELAVQWKPWPGMPDVQNVENALRNNPSKPRRLVNEGDVDAALAQGGVQAVDRTYVWPFQMHASIGPSCAVADWRGDGLTVYAGSQNPHVLRFDLSRLMGLPDVNIDVIRMEAAGCYGRNGADDVAADAALLSRAVGAPVRVQLTREQEHAWEPKGAAQLMQVRGGLNADGSPAGYDFESCYPSNGAPTLALLLTRSIEPVAQAFEMGDRTARPPYSYDNLRVTVNDMAPIVRASWLRGVSALPNSFAHESYIDELATAAGVDPVEYRLRHLPDPRAAELVRATADKAGWIAHTAPKPPNSDEWVSGQGFAYARYIHSKWPGFGAAWAAWVADVDVNRATGEVHVKRVVVGHDAGMMVNPAGVTQQVHGNVLQTTSRALKEQVQFEPVKNTVSSQEWGSYPILNFREVPVIEVMHMPRQGDSPLGAGESSSVPGTAAIANAIFDATGVRFRKPPFTPEVVREGLNSDPNLPFRHTPSAQPAIQNIALSGAVPGTETPRVPLLASAKPLWAALGGVALGVLGMAASYLGWPQAISPMAAGSTAGIYSPATIELGRKLAALGDCMVCHTNEDGAVPGQRGAGGRAMHTPFGTVYTTNLTPDAETGIGNWSLEAFKRAMREGISRDGHRLYPAFPYTAFAKTSDDDLTALYAYLMAQTPVRAATPAAEMRFPFNQRPMLAVWNGLFHDNTPFAPTSWQSAEWNRGAYLVQALGHCGACHTPRNALGAEQGGAAALTGAIVDGWEAPALTSLSRSPVPWTAQALFDYLRKGHSPDHGAVAGPMGPVVSELQALPDADIRVMATYLASLQTASAATHPVTASAVVAQAAAQAKANPLTQLSAAQRLFESACGACHHDGDGPKLLGLNHPLALSSKLHADTPDSLIQTILHGVQQPATQEIGFMPGFRHALSDAQVAELVTYMRARFAPGRAAWVLTP